ncbi:MULTISPECIES: hypothetical protein [Enterobacter cloacae complex]|uniref:hypothetical protein n=1 Tax=Enterobacter cloacae complex TaxID=354276 RepID=UPI000993E8A3|nr:hypothetical protein [Enterobacter kobei]QZS48735.1 hypothetical protein K6966_07530 [Enterobacter cloacae complex sp.]MCR1295190.1 hypothetical protein [Enterobacter kobei]MCR2774794.1 hypothetical protein [Enterobacter kobei]MCR2795829.1 hypothetical protein [Enterobacter kobei]MDS0023606.1 hypothetical protein [Enterobacter kobei]
MSTICLAAQRSYTTGEAVWFSYRLPRLRNIVSHAFLGMVALCAMIMAGLYAHVYWNLRHPAPEPVKASAAKPETQLSDMHYVYVSKPFPHPHPQPKPAPVQADVPAMQDLPINSDDADWQQAPDGDVPHDTSRDTLPGTEAHEAASASTGSDDASISELLKQALKEQEQDYSQGKIPAPPVDETQDNSQRDVNHKVDARSPLSEKGDRLE